MGLLAKGVEDCSMSIVLSGGGFAEAFEQRALLHLALNMHREALFDKALQLQTTPVQFSDSRRLLTLQLERLQRLRVVKEMQNFYKVLNVDERASTAQIRRRFLAICKASHPGTYYAFRSSTHNLCFVATRTVY